MKKIIIKDCMECPLVVTCKEFKSLPPKARFAMKTSPACAGILKTCPLEDDNTLDEGLKSAKRCLNVAKGCFDYGGGYRNNEKELEIYHHGIQTVVNCLEKFVKSNGNCDTQLNIVEQIGKISTDQE